jgi:hypothetical protein
MLHKEVNVIAIVQLQNIKFKKTDKVACIIRCRWKISSSNIVILIRKYGLFVQQDQQKER